MKLIPSFVARASNNPHTSISALVYVGAKFAAHFGAVWWPAHKAQFEQTSALVESAAVGYGFLRAGDADHKPPTQDPPKP